MKNIGGILLLLLLIFTAVSGVAGVYYFTQAETQKGELAELRIELKDLRTQVKDLKTRAKPDPAADGPSAAGATAPAGTASESGMVTINSPAPGQTIGTPAAVTGTAIAFESSVVVRVAGADGQVLKEVPAMTNAPDIGRAGDFAVDLHFTVPADTSGTVEVFEYSAEDGSEINKAVVPVRFSD